MRCLPGSRWERWLVVALTVLFCLPVLGQPISETFCNPADASCIPGELRVVFDTTGDSELPDDAMDRLQPINVSIEHETLVEGIAAWSFGVAHDDTHLHLDSGSVTLEGTVAGGALGPASLVLSGVTESTARRPAGVYSAVVLSFEETAVLPLGRANSLLRLRYLPRSDGISTVLRLVDRVIARDSQPVDLRFLIDGESLKPARLVHGRIRGDGAPPLVESSTDAAGGGGRVFRLGGERLQGEGSYVRMCGDVVHVERPRDDPEALLVTAPSCELTGPVDIEVCSVWGCTLVPAGFEYLPPGPVLALQAGEIASGGVLLEWTPPRSERGEAFGYHVERLDLERGDWTRLTDRPTASAHAIYLDETSTAALQPCYRVVSVAGDGSDGGVSDVVCVGGVVEFLRGDADRSGRVDISDAIIVLDFLFVFHGGRFPRCLDALDADDTGFLQITDAVYVLAWLFTSGDPMPAPGGLRCGADPTEDELDCESFEACE